MYPFPGMDPYLEDPTGWSSVHVRLINALSDALTAQVMPHFFVNIEQRVYVSAALSEAERRLIVPDVYLVASPSGQAEPAPAGAIAPPTLVEPSHPPEWREHYLEVVDMKNREVVTIIEVLSPFNKAPGARGYDTFRDKRQTVMASPVHWLEIDLLRAGTRPPEVAGRSDYYALLKRGDRPGPYEVWHFDLRDPMPTIAVPLRPPFADVPLDLQAAFTDMVSRARYSEVLDYSEPVPPPPLRPADAQWVAGQVAAWQQEASA